MKLGNKFKTALLNEDGVSIYIKGVFKKFIPWGEGGSTEDTTARLMAAGAQLTANTALETAETAVSTEPNDAQTIYSMHPLIFTDESGRKTGTITVNTSVRESDSNELVNIEGVFKQAKQDGSGYAINRRTVIDFRLQVIRVYRDNTLLNTIDLATLGK